MSTTKSDVSAFDSFVLVGARFAKISVDESKVLVGDDVKLSVTVECHAPEISPHKYKGRPVIEHVVSAYSVVDDELSEIETEHVFHVKCVAGFVGVDESHDGDLAFFKKAEATFARAIFWLVRERVQSVFSVTMLRSQDTLPWDLVGQDLPGQELQRSLGQSRRKAGKKATVLKRAPRKLK